MFESLIVSARVFWLLLSSWVLWPFINRGRTLPVLLRSDHMVISWPMGIRSVPVVEARAHFSALLAEVEAGMEVRITRRGRTVARLVPERESHAASLFEPFWADPPPDLVVPQDSSPEPEPDLD